MTRWCALAVAAALGAGCSAGGDEPSYAELTSFACSQLDDGSATRDEVTIWLAGQSVEHDHIDADEVERRMLDRCPDLYGR